MFCNNSYAFEQMHDADNNDVDFQEIEIVGMEQIEGNNMPIILGLNESGEDILFSMEGIEIVKHEEYVQYFNAELKSECVVFHYNSTESGENKQNKNIDMTETNVLKGVVYLDGKNINEELLDKKICKTTQQ